jgi:hypothetical protein
MELQTHQVSDLDEKSVADAEGGVWRPHVGALLVCHAHGRERHLRRRAGNIQPQPTILYAIVLCNPLFLRKRSLSPQCHSCDTNWGPSIVRESSPGLQSAYQAIYSPQIPPKIPSFMRTEYSLLHTATRLKHILHLLIQAPARAFTV